MERRITKAWTAFGANSQRYASKRGSEKILKSQMSCKKYNAGNGDGRNTQLNWTTAGRVEDRMSGDPEQIPEADEDHLKDGLTIYGDERE